MEANNDEVQITGSQVAGVVLGGVIGNVKGTSAGGMLAMAALPILGPFALLLVPAGALLGTYTGVKIGSKGVGRAAMMGVTGVVVDVAADGLGLGGDHSSKST